MGGAPARHGRSRLIQPWVTVTPPAPSLLMLDPSPVGMSGLDEPEAVTHDGCQVGRRLPSLLRVLPLASVSPSLSIFITPAFLPPPQGTVHAPRLHVHPCEAARANAVTHTPLCLYLIIGSITGEIFPDNATEGGEPGRAPPIWGGGAIPHHVEPAELALPPNETNEFNIFPFRGPGDLLKHSVFHGRSSYFS